jgi:site-specific DNA-adenine methylase
MLRFEMAKGSCCLTCAAVFFDLHAAGRLRDRDVVLIDWNADLIGCYETVRAQPDEVASGLDRLAAAHARGGQTQ